MKKILGLDLGTKTLGIAISDSLGLAAHGYENFNFEEFNYKKAREHVIEITKEEDIDEIALGYPLHMNGELSNRAKSCIRFKDDLLALNPNLKIELVDERLSTVEAQERMHNLGYNAKQMKKNIDMMAAVVILETYMSKKGQK